MHAAPRPPLGQDLRLSRTQDADRFPPSWDQPRRRGIEDIPLGSPWQTVMWTLSLQMQPCLSRQLEGRSTSTSRDTCATPQRWSAVGGRLGRSCPCGCIRACQLAVKWLSDRRKTRPAAPATCRTRLPNCAGATNGPERHRAKPNQTARIISACSRVSIQRDRVEFSPTVLQILAHVRPEWQHPGRRR